MTIDDINMRRKIELSKRSTFSVKKEKYSHFIFDRIFKKRREQDGRKENTRKEW